MLKNANTDGKKGKILSRDGKHIGTTTGGKSRQCRLESCKGERVGVRWDDDKLTYPCTAGMHWNAQRNACQIH